jgi:hypothetical protein
VLNDSVEDFKPAIQLADNSARRFMTRTCMKKRSLGWPSSARRKFGFENEVNSCISLVDAVTVKFLKYGAAFAKEMTSAG